MFSELYWNLVKFRVMFWKGSHWSWQLVKVSKSHNLIIIIINLFHQVLNVSMRSAQRYIFLIARVFDIRQFDMLQKCFNCSYRGSMSLLTRIVEPSTHWKFNCSKASIKALEQSVKLVQSKHERHQNEIKWSRSGVFIVDFVHCTA